MLTEIRFMFRDFRREWNGNPCSKYGCHLLFRIRQAKETRGLITGGPFMTRYLYWLLAIPDLIVRAIKFIAHQRQLSRFRAETARL